MADSQVCRSVYVAEPGASLYWSKKPPHGTSNGTSCEETSRMKVLAVPMEPQHSNRGRGQSACLHLPDAYPGLQVAPDPYGRVIASRKCPSGSAK